MSRWWRGSLRRRVAAIVAGAVALAVILVAVLTWFVVANQFRGSLDTALDREASRVQRLISVDAEWMGDTGSDCRYVVEPACVRRITTTDTGGTGALRVNAAARAVAEGSSPRAWFTQDGVRVLVLPTGRGEAVMVGLPTRQIDIALERTAIALTATGAVGVVLAAGLGTTAATAGLRPVHRLDAAVRRVRAAADPNASLDLDQDSDRDDELGRLTRSFAAMLTELATAQDAQRDFVADASHELRTPLTTLRTNIQLLTGERPLAQATREALTAALLHETDAMTRTVEDLAELARGDRAARAALSAEDVLPAVRDAAAAAERRWPCTVTVTASVSDARALTPDGRLTRLLDVVLDNAGKYGAGRPVLIRVERDSERIVILVTDRGTGIPANEREKVFERFHRGTATRGTPGSGLGLAIAAQIVADAGGRITAEAGPDGGTTIRIVLDAA